MPKITPSSLAVQPSGINLFPPREYDAARQYSPDRLGATAMDFSTQTYDSNGHPVDSDTD
jgi:hypothetical protein